MKTKLLNIDDAEWYTKMEYGEYCNEQIVKGEIPLSFSKWYVKMMRTASPEKNKKQRQ
jgi:hypothetical protein